MKCPDGFNGSKMSFHTGSRRSPPPLALSVPLSRFTSRVGGGSAFCVRRLHTMRTFIIFLSIAVVGALLQGCATPQRTSEPEKTLSLADVRVDFTDPVLNSRKILLFGPIDQRAAEAMIQKLLFLDSKG